MYAYVINQLAFRFQELIKHGANTEATQGEGAIDLMKASQNGHLGVVEVRYVF